MYFEVILGADIHATRWHLYGAKILLDNLQAVSHHTSRFYFLQKLFAFFDVMIAFSLREPPLGESDMLMGGALFMHPHDPSFVPDPVFGLAGTLHPLLHCLACLMSQKAKHVNVDEPAAVLEQHLLAWYPPIPPSKPGAEPFPDCERLLQTAFAFRSAALLVLYSDIAPGRNVLAHDCYKSLFDSLVRVDSLAMGGHGIPTPFSTILWPLHTASMKAKDPGERAVLKRIFENVNGKHRMKIVEMAGQHANSYWDNGEPFCAGAVMYG